jgi:hypothetical protein
LNMWWQVLSLASGWRLTVGFTAAFQGHLRAGNGPLSLKFRALRAAYSRRRSRAF